MSFTVPASHASKTATSLSGRDRDSALSPRTALAALVALTLLAAFLGEAWLLSRPQDRLDPRFGSRGLVATAIVQDPYGPIADFGPAVVGPGGTIVAGGSIANDFAIVRYTGDGHPDAAFGNGGLVQTRVNGPGRVWGLALQPGGRILAAGTAVTYASETPAPSRLVVVRYRTDGFRDDAFGRAGIVEIAGWHDRAAVAIAPDGKIVVAGTALARFSAAGGPDTSFGTKGIAEIPDGGLAAVAVGRDGKIVVAGSILARFSEDGRLDPTFGSNGVADTAAIGSIHALALTPDGEILVGGDVLARYTAEGRIDSTFGHGGMASGVGAVHAVAIAPDGRIIAGGTVSAETGRFALGRYLQDGSPDRTFGSGGIVTTDIGGRLGGIRALVVLPDGGIVAAGFRWSQGCGWFLACGSETTMLLARYVGR